MEVLESELGKYRINVMGLAKTKWKGKEGHYYTTEGNIDGLVYNYGNSVCENFSGDAKNVLNFSKRAH